MTQNQRPSQSMVREFTRQYLLISIIPVALFFVVAVSGGIYVKRHLAGLITAATHELTMDAKKELETLGQTVIKEKAWDAARQVNLFLDAHPKADMTMLQGSELFRSIALQPVGRTGYVCLYEAGGGVMRLHPNAALIDRRMDFLAQELPSWWAIFAPSLSGAEVSGYYDWIEPDGSVRKKYMTMTPVATPLQGRTLMVAATTYIDEFSAPVAAMTAKAAAVNASVRTLFTDQMLIAAAITATFLLATFLCVLLIGRRSALHYMRPIVGLAATAKGLGDGQWNAAIAPVVLQRRDEIGVLARSFDSMRRQLQHLFGDLESRLAQLKQAEQSLKESEAHFRGLFEGVPVGLYRTTFDGRIIDINATLVRMFGYPSKEAFLSTNAAETYARAQDRSRWQTLIADSGGQNLYEVEMRRYDGSLLWVENHSRTVRDEDNAIRHIEGSLIDVTERKNAEKALHESERRYRALYEEAERSKELYRSLLHSSADAILICDMEQRTTYVSPVFTQLFGWSLEEVGGRQIPFIPERERASFLSMIREVLEKGTRCHGSETRRYTRDGRTVEVSVSISRYEDHQGRPAGVLQILRDIGDRKSMENQLQFAQRMEAVGTLAGGLAHDFNNLMMGILGNVSMMMLDTPLDHPHREKLQKIDRLIQSGSTLTSQLLGYARKGKFELKVLDLAQVVRDSAEIFGRTRKQIAITMDLGQTGIPVEMDRSQIEQVLFNLFINAADAMSNGGALTIRATTVPHDEIRDKPYHPAPGDYARLQVTDNGHGMDPETQSRVFDPFFTTKEMGRGTGLGLASAYGIVKSHAGYIDVQSKVGRGTTFTLYLPVSRKQSTAAPMDDARITFGRGTVLVVDDEEVVLEVGAEMIARLGYRTRAARNGEEAVALFGADPAGFDLVVLDLIMPGTSGSDTFDRLRALDPEVKVLLASGYSIDSQAMALMERGCNGFIQKPYSLEDLSRKIDAVLKG